MIDSARERCTGGSGAESGFIVSSVACRRGICVDWMREWVSCSADGTKVVFVWLATDAGVHLMLMSVVCEDWMWTTMTVWEPVCSWADGENGSGTWFEYDLGVCLAECMTPKTCYGYKSVVRWFLSRNAFVEGVGWPFRAI